MAEWATFVGVTGVVLVLLLVMARASAAVLSGDSLATDESGNSITEPATQTGSGAVDELSPGSNETTGSTETTIIHVDEIVAMVDERPPSVVGNGRHDGRSLHIESLDAEREPGGLPADRTGGHHPQGERDHQGSQRVRGQQQSRTELELSTPALLANVAISQGVFGMLLVTMAWYTEIPAWAFGLAPETLTVEAVGVGVAVGGVLYGLNEAAAAVGRQQEVATPAALREALAPETAIGWAVLLVVVLPIIAGVEELLFRGALIGVVGAGFGVSPWLLAVGSSVAFALGHGAQGRLGIVVTGVLGLGLAAVFVVTGSLVVVVVAHYVINVLEFVVHEGLGLA